MPTDPAEQLRALAATIERYGRRVDDLDKRSHAELGELRSVVDQVAVDVANLTSIVTATADDDDPPRVRSWLLGSDPDVASSQLSDLAEWIDAVYRWYPSDHGPLPPCWPYHPAAVEELLWLRRCHAAAYHPHTGDWLRVADWHDRLRPRAAERVSKHLGPCEAQPHPGRDAVPQRRAGAVQRVVPAVAAAWIGDRSIPPVPEGFDGDPPPRSPTDS